MASTSGTVNHIYINSQWGCVNLATGSGDTLLLLWSYSSDTPTAEERILHNQWLSLARDAFANSNSIEVEHDSGSALATSVRLF